MSASCLSMAAASSSLCSNKLCSHLSLTQIPTHHLPSFIKTPKSLQLKLLKLKAQNPTSLHFSSLPSLPHFRHGSGTFGGFEVTEDDPDDPETERAEQEAGVIEEEEQEEAVQEEEQKVVAEAKEEGRLYVGNLPYSMTSSQLAEIFGEAGTVVSAEIVYDRVTDRSRGFGFVAMATVEQAQEAIRLFDGSQIGGRTVKVNFPEVPRGGERTVMGPKIQNSYRSFIDSPHKIYAGNLGWALTSQGLRDAFASQPGLLSAKVIYERDTGRSRGFGFISFETVEDLQTALNAMNGVEVEGRPLRLSVANERAPPVSSSPLDRNAENSVDSTELLSGIGT